MLQMINTRLSSSTSLTANGVIPLGAVVHKSGCTITAGNNTIKVDGNGYYKVSVNATLAPTAVAPCTVALTNNGNTIAQSTATPAVANDAVNVSMQAIIYNKCSCIDNLLNLTVSASCAVTESEVIVERI